MEKVYTFLFVAALLIACAQISRKEAPDVSSVNTDSSVTANAPALESMLYEQEDSTFVIHGEKFRVMVKQYDLTDLATTHGDTLSRPTYSCAARIMDADGRTVFADSLVRDSWGYPGKIVSIQAYQIALPQLHYAEPDIVLAFNIFEETDGDAIEGVIAFDVNTRKVVYSWREAQGE